MTTKRDQPMDIEDENGIDDNTRRRTAKRWGDFGGGDDLLLEGSDYGDPPSLDRHFTDQGLDTTSRSLRYGQSPELRGASYWLDQSKFEEDDEYEDIYGPPAPEEDQGPAATEADGQRPEDQDPTCISPPSYEEALKRKRQTEHEEKFLRDLAYVQKTLEEEQKKLEEAERAALLKEQEAQALKRVQDEAAQRKIKAAAKKKAKEEERLRLEQQIKEQEELIQQREEAKRQEKAKAEEEKRKAEEEHRARAEAALEKQREEVRKEELRKQAADEAEKEERRRIEERQEAERKQKEEEEEKRRVKEQEREKLRGGTKKKTKLRLRAHSPEAEEQHQPDLNSMAMVIDQCQDQIKNLQGQLSAAYEAVEILTAEVQKKDLRHVTREKEWKDALEADRKYHAGVLKEMKSDRDRRETALLEELQKMKIHHKSELDELSRRLAELQVLGSETSSVDGEEVEGAAKGNLDELRKTAFQYVPGTVNTNRGAATYESTHQPFGVETGLGKSVHFEDEMGTSSTPNPLKSKSRVAQPDLSRIDPARQEESYLDSPRPTPAPRPKKNTTTTSSRSNTSTKSDEANFSVALAKEFRKFKEPKISTLKGGYSSDASLFFKAWERDITSIIQERELTDEEAVRLIKEKTEGNALKEVQFYLDLTDRPTCAGLLSHLMTAYTSGEDSSSIAQEFYSRTQKPKESDDIFADELQVLARKMVTFRPMVKSTIEQELKNQFCVGLKDPYYGSLARTLLAQRPGLGFTQFRCELARIFGGRSKFRKAALVTHGVQESGEKEGSSSTTPQSPKGLSKNQKKRRKREVKAQMIQDLQEKLDSALAVNQQYQEVLNPTALQNIITQAVSKSNKPEGKPTDTSNNPFSKPYLGRPRPSQLRPGFDGKLDPAQSCRYCKDTGHELDNCVKLRAKLDRQQQGEPGRTNPAPN